MVLLGTQERHPAVFEIATLLAAAEELSSRLRAQAAVQKDMPAALLRLIQTEFNKSFQHVFTSHLPVLWPHFTPLIQTLTTVYLFPGTVTMPGGLRHSLPTTVTAHRTAALPHKNSTSLQRGWEAYTVTLQVAAQNPASLPHLQVGPGFRLRKSMEKSADVTSTPMPQTDNSCPFCLSYHLKGV